MTMMKLIFSIFIASLITGGCVHNNNGSNTENILLPTTLASRSDFYDGKHVDVRGYVVIRPERRMVCDTEFSAQDRKSICLGLAGPDAMFQKFHSQFAPKISGIFRKELCPKDEICLYWNGPGIELDKASKL